MPNKVEIYIAKPSDAPALLAIYRPYVEKTAITFEYEVPSIAEFTKRIAETLPNYPYLLAKTEDRIVGYAYASRLHERPAYDWAVEMTIYIAEDAKKMGIGKKLYQALEMILSLQGIVNLNACIAVPEKEDEYLNKNSMEFHHHLGYRLIGEFYQCGYKFNRWYNMVWMEKHIGPHLTDQPPVVPFAAIREEIAAKYNLRELS